MIYQIIKEEGYVMIKVENIEVWGFEHAIRGMRNPLNSWDKSDSKICPGRGFDD